MGNPKQKWTADEEKALRAGVDKHGAGKWRTIQKDPEFEPFLAARTNIDLKDKWRNMSVSASGQGSRERSRRQKIKGPATESTDSPNSAATAPRTPDASVAIADSSRKPQDGKRPVRYTMMITEALSELQDPNGSEIGAICKFIEQRHSVPPNLGKLLSGKLRRLTALDKIEKVKDRYKLKDSVYATNNPSPKQTGLVNHWKPAQNGKLRDFNDALEEATRAAYWIADAEAKEFFASEAVKESERVAIMAEDEDSIVQLAIEILERCKKGEIIPMV